jgi:hypothetical protein
MFLVPSFNVDVPGLGASLILSEPWVENFQSQGTLVPDLKINKNHT